MSVHLSLHFRLCAVDKSNVLLYTGNPCQVWTVDAVGSRVWRTYHAPTQNFFIPRYCITWLNIPFKFFAEFWGRNPADFHIIEPIKAIPRHHHRDNACWFMGKFGQLPEITVFTEKLTDDSRIVCICSREARSKQLIANSEWSLSSWMSFEKIPDILSTTV